MSRHPTRAVSAPDRVARALLALPPDTALAPASVAAMLTRLGLIEGDASPVAAGDTSWRGTFGGLPVMLSTGADADALKQEASAARGAILMTPESVLALEARQSRGDAVKCAQSVCSLAALIADALGARALYWQPARLWSPTALLADAVIALESDGLPPVLHIVGFDRDVASDASGIRALRTSGLGWLVGHEMRLNCPSSYSDSDALRRASRLAVDAMVHRGLVGPMTVAGMEHGETVDIGPEVAGEPWPLVTVECRPPPS